MYRSTKVSTVKQTSNKLLSLTKSTPAQIPDQRASMQRTQAQRAQLQSQITQVIPQHRHETTGSQQTQMAVMNYYSKKNEGSTSSKNEDGQVNQRPYSQTRELNQMQGASHT